MKRFSLHTVWAVFLFPLLFIGCPGQTTSTGGSSDTSSGGTAAGNPAAVPAPPKGGPGPVNVIPFGGDQEKIKKKMGMISGAEMRLDTTSQGESALSYKGGQFGGFAVTDWTFLFHQGQMMHAQVNYNEETAGIRADSIFNAMSILLSRQYGEPIIDSKNMISKPLSAYSEGAQEFLAEIGKALPQQFKIWTAGADAKYVITLNKVQWNTAGGPTFVHLAFYDRALSEDHLKTAGK